MGRAACGPVGSGPGFPGFSPRFGGHPRSLRPSLPADSRPLAASASRLRDFHRPTWRYRRPPPPGHQGGTVAQMSRQPPEEPVRMAAVPTEPASQAPALLDPAGVVREFNTLNPQHEALGTRIVHMVDAARHLGEQARQAADPERRVPRWRQLLLAGGTLSLDAVACYFAAQALGNGQDETLAWTALFLAVLGAGEFALDFYRDRHRRVWRYIAIGLGGFVTGL